MTYRSNIFIIPEALSAGWRDRLTSLGLKVVPTASAEAASAEGFIFVGRLEGQGIAGDATLNRSSSTGELWLEVTYPTAGDARLEGTIGQVFKRRN